MCIETEHAARLLVWELRDYLNSEIRRGGPFRDMEYQRYLQGMCQDLLESLPRQTVDTPEESS